MADKNLDMDIYNDVKSKAEDLESMYGQRTTDFEAYEKIYLMDWTGKPNDSDLKLTISPDGRNAIQGVTNLLTVSNPIFSIPIGRGIDTNLADKIEKACDAWWNGSSRCSRTSLHKDAIKSAAIYGEVYIAQTSTQELVTFAEKQKDKASVARAQKIALTTPFLYEIHNPKYSYPFFDAMGLSSYYRKIKVKVGELPARYGEVALEYAEGKKLTEEVEVSIWYDTLNYAVWVENQAFIALEHGLPVIPVTCVITDGSMIFDKPEQQRQPLLYAVHKGELWERENLILTVLYTNVYGLGLTPTMIHTAPAGNPEKKFTWDSSNPIVNFEQGETLTAVTSKGIIDDSFTIAMQLAEKKFEESTIYRQSIGEPLTGQNAYSAISLLTQSGRLPIVGIQTQCALAYASALETSMTWYKQLGQKFGDLEPSKIPDNLQLDCKLKADLPQDKRQDMAYIESGIKLGVFSKEYSSQTLGVEQWATMFEDIQSERILEAEMIAETEVKIAEIKLKAQQRIQQQMQDAQKGNTDTNIAGGGMMQGSEMPTETLQPESMGEVGNGLPGLPMGGVPLEQMGEEPNVNPTEQR